MDTFITSVNRLALVASLLAGASGFTASPARGQGVTGFSSQTQSSVIQETQVIDKKAYTKFRNQAEDQKKKITPAVKRLTYVESVADTSVSIADAATLLGEFDDLRIEPESRRNLGSWSVGIVSDGDFNKSISSTVATGKAGSLGIDAVFMKPVYTRYTYYLYNKKLKPLGKTENEKAEYNRKHSIDNLVGYQTVARPRVAVNALVVLFSGTPALTTGVLNTQTGRATVNPGQQRIFGQALLVPAGYVVGNGLSFTGNATWYFGRFGPGGSAQNNAGESGRWGLAGSLTAVQTNWSSRDTATSVNILAPSVGLVYRLAEGHLNVRKQDTYTQIQPFARYTMRHLFGDVAGRPMLLSDAIGTRRRTYHALDLGVTLSINAVRLTTNIPVFFNSKIEGFSRGQLIAGFGLAASIPVSE